MEASRPLQNPNLYQTQLGLKIGEINNKGNFENKWDLIMTFKLTTIKNSK